MKLLLDTCTFLWMIASPVHLSQTARDAITERSQGLLLNQVSLWEMQIKYQKGRLPLSVPPKQVVERALAVYPIEIELISNEAIWHLQKLPDIHKDPYDRLLISQALIHGHKLVTPDPVIHQYPVACLW
jgi:PIN domain nuclease of toxin-antitoxin system